MARTGMACVPKNLVIILENEYKHDFTIVGHLKNILEYPTADRNTKNGPISTKKTLYMTATQDRPQASSPLIQPSNAMSKVNQFSKILT